MRQNRVIALSAAPRRAALVRLLTGVTGHRDVSRDRRPRRGRRGVMQAGGGVGRGETGGAEVPADAGGHRTGRLTRSNTVQPSDAVWGEVGEVAPCVATLGEVGEKTHPPRRIASTDADRHSTIDAGVAFGRHGGRGARKCAPARSRHALTVSRVIRRMRPRLALTSFLFAMVPCVAGPACGGDAAKDWGELPPNADAGLGDAADADEPPCDQPDAPAGCPCDTDAACASGVCAAGLDGSRCLARCDEGTTCDSGICLPTDSDSEYVCVAPSDLLCLPCTRDSDCRQAGGEAECVVAGNDGAFCATTCDSDDACPGDFGCVNGLCLPDAGLCPCTDLAVALGTTTVCVSENAFGSCDGLRRCEVGGLSPCDAASPAAETCNGRDDDCDGANDEGPVSCDDSDPCTRDDVCTDGACVGTPTCACETDADCETPPPGLDAACVSGRCGGDGACVYETRVGACDDGDPCTVDDACDGGRCEAAALDCSHLDAACSAGVCDGQGGCTVEAVACGISRVRLHIPGVAMSRHRTIATGVSISAGHGGPVGLVVNGNHRIHFGFHPGIHR